MTLKVEKELTFTIIGENDQLAKSVRKKIEINKETITKLNQKLGDRESYGAGTAACFDPHLGLFTI
jgi:hypothetical protein